MCKKEIIKSKHIATCLLPDTEIHDLNIVTFDECKYLGSLYYSSGGSCQRDLEMKLQEGKKSILG